MNICVLMHGSSLFKKKKKDFHHQTFTEPLEPPELKALECCISFNPQDNQCDYLILCCRWRSRGSELLSDGLLPKWNWSQESSWGSLKKPRECFRKSSTGKPGQKKVQTNPFSLNLRGGPYKKADVCNWDQCKDPWYLGPEKNGVGFLPRVISK